MPKAIRIHKNGGPEVLSLDEVVVGDPGPGEARVQPSCSRPEFHRHLFPYRPVSVTVVAGGPGFRRCRRGRGGRRRRHARQGGRPRRLRRRRAGRLLRRAGDAGRRAGEAARRHRFEQGAAMMLQGMTVQYLIKQSYPVKAGDTVLWTAAAGGVGLIACSGSKRSAST